MSADRQGLPRLELERDQIQRMLAPLLSGGDVASVERQGDGLVNAVYRVVPAAPRPVLAVRAYASGIDAFERERQALEQLAGRLPVPEVLLADRAGAELPCPYVVYRWVDGITLNECRRRMGPAALLALAEPLGQLLADVASVSFARELAPSRDVASSLANAHQRLRDGLARTRLGSPLADALCDRLESAAFLLEGADRLRGLAHGDFGGRNVIVAPTDDATWRIAALLDWEHAFMGATLWDVGSLFRYASRYSSTFRDRFELGYRNAGGVLPDDWHSLARLLDATRLVGILSEELDLPGVFAECRELVSALVSESAP